MSTRVHRKAFRATILLACYRDFHRQEKFNALT